MVDWHCGKRKAWHLTVCMKTRERSTRPYGQATNASIESGWAIKPQPNCSLCCNYFNFDHFQAKKRGTSDSSLPYLWNIISAITTDVWRTERQEHLLQTPFSSIRTYFCFELTEVLTIYHIQCRNLYVPFFFFFSHSFEFFTQFLARMELIL